METHTYILMEVENIYKCVGNCNACGLQEDDVGEEKHTHTFFFFCLLFFIRRPRAICVFSETAFP